MPLDYDTAVGQVRLLVNDTAFDPVFSDAEIEAFLTMEGDSVKLAAAQALDVIADDEVLTSKVIRSQDLSTNGATVAAQLRERAKGLRSQAGVGVGGSMVPTGYFPDAPDDKPWR